MFYNFKGGFGWGGGGRLPLYHSYKILRDIKGIYISGKWVSVLATPY